MYKNKIMNDLKKNYLISFFKLFVPNQEKKEKRRKDL